MDDALRAELLAMRADDRAAATASFHASEADPRFRGKFRFQIPVDDWVPEFEHGAQLTRRHGSRMCEIVLERGWPGKSLVGDDGADAAFFLVQHAGPEVQRICVPALRVAVDGGEAEAEHLAAVCDRIELESGRMQVYATHLALDEAGNHVPLIGVADSVHLDERRIALGLEPWAVYVERFRLHEPDACSPKEDDCGDTA